jgi:hypothetical protein
MRPRNTSKKYSNKKHKKTVKRLKTRQNKKRVKRNTMRNIIRKRMKFRGGMNDLGRIFMDIVKNKKIYEEESGKNDAQSNAYEQAGWKIEDLTEEMKKTVNNEEKFNKIMNMVDEYIYTEKDQKRELESNRIYYNEGNGGQGDYYAQNAHAEVLIMLRDELGVDIDPDEVSTPTKSRDFSLEGEPESPKKRKKMFSEGDAAKQYEHVFNI